VPERATDIVLQGLQHLSIAVRQLFASYDKALHISFILHGLIWMEDSSRLRRGIEFFREQLLETFDQCHSNLLGPDQKMAVLMGLHGRLGKKSSLCVLNRDILERIFEILEMERVHVDFPDPMYSDSELQ
jgi:hypothetical protein